jgi:glyoxylase-like metal-dependent hydrolase (beta-lactamase superfamily II)
MIPAMQRREFLELGLSCAAQLTLWQRLAPPGLRERFTARAGGPVVAAEVWGRIEQVGDGVWALISTPLAGGPDARRTLANGGIVAGTHGVAIIEGFASDAGAEWMAGIARELTGRAPTHVILTHYHGDHAGGLAAYRAAEAAPLYVTTAATRGKLAPDGKPRAALERAQLAPTDAPTTIDLGRTTLTVVPRSGHTASDLVVEVDDARVVFAGDLLWNGMFPNYRDAVPSLLSQSVRALLRDPRVRVPGHGAIPTAAEAANYVAVIDLVEAAARKAITAGTPIDVAAREFVVPASLGEWKLFNPAYYQVALGAWEKELKPQ